MLSAPPLGCGWLSSRMQGRGKEPCTRRKRGCQSNPGLQRSEKALGWKPSSFPALASFPQGWLLGAAEDTVFQLCCVTLGRVSVVAGGLLYLSRREEVIGPADTCANRRSSAAWLTS